ncbi:MAG: hypothetical protein R2769_05375 [Saprospiraceae bacterium]
MFHFLLCQHEKQTLNSKDQSWSIEKLKEIAERHLDSSKWGSRIDHQDIATYQKYSEILKSYPLNKSPFPVATYDYAVSSTPLILKLMISFKVISIGEFESPDSDTVRNKLCLMVLTNDHDARNPAWLNPKLSYLTAQVILNSKITNMTGCI